MAILVRLHKALLSYGIPIEEVTAETKVANSRRDEGKGWWSQWDSNRCFNSTAPSSCIIAGLANFFQVGIGSSSFSLQLHVDEFYF